MAGRRSLLNRLRPAAATSASAEGVGGAHAGAYLAGGGSPWRRRAGWTILAFALLLHGLVGWQVGALLAPLDTSPVGMQRIQAAYTRSVAQADEPAAAQPAQPPAAARPAPRPGAAQARSLTAQQLAAEQAAAMAAAEREALRERALAAVEAALDPAQAASEPRLADDPAALAAARAAAAAAASSAAAPAVAGGSSAPALAAAPAPALPASPAAAASAPAVAAADTPMLLEGVPWPVSTRLSYSLHGWYNGDVYGQAQVEWLREGRRYQVHLDVSVGPSLAPLVTRRMSSEGRIGTQGLVPQRYQQVTKQIIGRTRSAQITFEDAEIALERGRRVPQQAGVQDTASQFIQMIFLFTTRAELRETGRAIEFPLALPHRVDRWTYDVGARETVETPVGAMETFHVKPRRAAAPGDLTVEIWYAPRLQWLPVRIFIRQDENTWVDLKLEKAPEQAAS